MGDGADGSSPTPIPLVVADVPDSFLDDTPTVVLIRQMLGSVSQFKWAILLAKLRAVESGPRLSPANAAGRKSYVERDGEMVALISEEAGSLTGQ